MKDSELTLVPLIQILTTSIRCLLFFISSRFAFVDFQFYIDFQVLPMFLIASFQFWHQFWQYNLIELVTQLLCLKLQREKQNIILALPWDYPFRNAFVASILISDHWTVLDSRTKHNADSFVEHFDNDDSEYDVIMLLHNMVLRHNSIT